MKLLQWIRDQKKAEGMGDKELAKLETEWGDPPLTQELNQEIVDNRERIAGEFFRTQTTETLMQAPCLGEHNEYVMTQLLGMSDEEFVRLMGEGVLE